ncbi:MAG: zinc-ribbon domain-containing protein [Desulfobulbus sp.]|nr:zinc-ribbon domain-containing protein [Desulfobulbus sp.]
MKIKCPKCEKIYNIPDEKIPNHDVRTSCKVCGEVITIKRKSSNIEIDDSKTITCPKCGGISSNNKECTECGIVFGKYNKKEIYESKHSNDVGESQSKNKKSKNILIFSSVGLLIIVILFSIPSIVSIFNSSSGIAQNNKTEKEYEINANNQNDHSVDLNYDKTVFGIDIGESFINQIPQCPYGEIPTTTCYRPDPVTRTDLVNGYIKVELYRCPIFVDSLYVRIYDGNVEGFRFYLDGRKYEQDALSALIKKWGKPNSYRDVKLVNGFGAKFSSFEASWKIGDILCFFAKATNSKRYVSIYTSYGLNRENNEFEQKYKTKTTL